MDEDLDVVTHRSIDEGHHIWGDGVEECLIKDAVVRVLLEAGRPANVIYD